MVRFKKWSVALLVFTMVIMPVLSACSSDPSTSDSEVEGDEGEEVVDNLNLEGMPIVKEPIDLTFVAPSKYSLDWNDVMIYNEYEKMTNMNIKWEMISEEGLKEKTNLMLVSGDYPDAFHSADLTPQDIITYGEQGVFIPLNDLIDEYAPNLKQLMEEYPEIERGITMPDGNIYSFPRIFDPDFTSVLMGWKLWLNQEFMDALDIDEPETLDEFYEYLKAVKEGDPNGNGEADEIPLALSGDTNLINVLKGSFGLGNRGASHRFVDADPETGEPRFMPTDDRYKEMLEYINKLYEEGLINENLYTVKDEERAALGQDGLYGATVITDPAPNFGLDYYIGAKTLEGPHGDRLYSNYIAPLVHVGGFVITDKNPYPEATVRWMDYIYSDEGTKFYFMGIEGETYEENPDGTVQYTDVIENNPDGLSYTEAISKFLTWRGIAYPAIVREKYFKGSEGLPTSIEAAEKVANDVPEETWPPFNFLVEESEIMSTVGNDIEEFVTESQAKFITGRDSFDEWDNYVETLNRMGLDQYMDIYNAAYERYMETAQ